MSKAPTTPGTGTVRGSPSIPEAETAARLHDRYDAVIAGARCAGAATALLLAREGARVLVVDPLPRGRDALSTHALMRGGVLQLHRWGLLDAVRESGAPPVRTTTFHYGDEVLPIDIEPADGVDALYAPRRTLLDPLLEDAAVAAGAHVLRGSSVSDLVRDARGWVRGAVVTGPGRPVREIAADLVVGADGIRSRVARLLSVPVERAGVHATATVYGYAADLEPGAGYHWYFRPGASAGAIPTNDGLTCLFAALPAGVFERERRGGLEALHQRTLHRVAPELAEVGSPDRLREPLRAFAGQVGFLRRASGPGWALVGDAGYFRDPSTAHGISDAFRDAELLARAVLRGTEEALADYQAARDAVALPVLDVTDRISSLDWTLEEVQALHLELSRAMKVGVETVRGLDAPHHGPSRVAVAAGGPPGTRKTGWTAP